MIMKTRTSRCKENACNLKKLKKSVRKDRLQPKEHVETRPRLPVQQNRFTNILELSTLSANLIHLHDLFGTLVLDFSQDPVQMKISDVTGNYELNVSKESLSEFKMKVLLGQNSKGKPAFTIFLGECQCYPELPEGTLELNANQNDNTGSQIDSIDDESRSEAKVDIGSDDKANAPTDDIGDDPQNHGNFENDDMAAPLFALFEGNEATAASPKNLVSYETHHISISESQKLGPLSNSDELIVKVRPKQVSSKGRKNRSQKKPGVSTAARRASKKRSAYRSNLEGFVKFLMTDRVCGRLLDKMKAPGNVAHTAKRISQQMVVNYSDGLEYRMFFSKEKGGDKAVQQRGPTLSHSDNRETDLSHENDNESTGDDGIQVLFERTKPFQKAAFVEQVKKELEEWQAKGEQTVNVKILEDENPSTEDSDSNVVTAYEDPKAPKKLDSEFDDATSNCSSEAVVESAEGVFLDLKEKEKPEITEEKDELDLLKGIQFGLAHKRESEEYEAPIPLETTSTADIEAMWLNFVETFHRSSELAKKLSVSSQEIVEHFNMPEPKVEVERSTDDPNRLSSGYSYPGQHYLPYFVEESLKKVNSMWETWRTPNPLPNVMRKPQDAICTPQMPNLSRLEGDLTLGNKFHFDPKHFDAPTGPSFHHHPTLPRKFSIKKSRIFFNPYASIGDWH